MSEKNSLVLYLSEAQLFKTKKPNTVVSDLSEKTGLSEAKINGTMLYDQFIAPAIGAAISPLIGENRAQSLGFRSYIDDYKTGKISKDEEFFKGIRRRLGKNENDLDDNSLKNSWNRMCEFSSQAKNECQQVAQILKSNSDVNLVFVSETNSMQHEYNMEQFKKAVGGDEKFEQIESQINFVRSDEMGYMGKSSLAINGTKKLQEQGKLAQNKDITNVVSLHGAIDSSSVLSEGKIVSAVRESSGRSLNIKTNSSSNIADIISSEFERVKEQRNNSIFAIAA